MMNVEVGLWANVSHAHTDVYSPYTPRTHRLLRSITARSNLQAERSSPKRKNILKSIPYVPNEIPRLPSNHVCGRGRPPSIKPAALCLPGQVWTFRRPIVAPFAHFLIRNACFPRYETINSSRSPEYNNYTYVCVCACVCVCGRVHVRV